MRAANSENPSRGAHTSLRGEAAHGPLPQTLGPGRLLLRAPLRC